VGENAVPVDRPVLSLDELSGIPDLDASLLEGIKPYFSVFPLVPTPAGSGVNPNTAPPHILGMIYHGTAGDKRLLDRDDVFRILTARDEDKIFCKSEYGEKCESFTALTGFVGETFFPRLQYVSSIFTIRTEGRYRAARACVITVVDRSSAEAPQTLFYRTGC
jgi:type II secretory pathway component PulK